MWLAFVCTTYCNLNISPVFSLVLLKMWLNHVMTLNIWCSKRALTWENVNSLDWLARSFLSSFLRPSKRDLQNSFDRATTQLFFPTEIFPNVGKLHCEKKRSSYSRLTSKCGKMPSFHLFLFSFFRLLLNPSKVLPNFSWKSLNNDHHTKVLMTATVVSQPDWFRRKKKESRTHTS